MKAKAKKAPAAPKEKKKIGRPRKAPIGTSAGLHYSLEQIHGIWRATITLPNATVREFSLGTSNLAAAHDAAKIKAGQVARGLHWADKQNRKPRAAKTPAPPAPPPPAPAPPPPPAEPMPTPAPPPAAAAAPPAPEQRDEDIAAKLRSIGDQQPIKPDGVFPGGPENDPDDQAAADEQADELFADTVAIFAVMATLAIPKKILASRRPPLRPGKPDPWSLQAYTEGLQLGARKLMGAASLGPVGKTIAGAVGIMLSMFIGAEPMNPQQTGSAAPAPAPQPSPPSPAAPPPAPYSEDETALATTSNGSFSSVGTFR